MNEKIITENEKLRIKSENPGKIKYFSLFTLLFSFAIHAQGGLSTDKNYVYTKNCLNEDCSKKSEAVQYSDDLGHTLQAIAIKATPGGKDVVTPFEYDAFGRPVKSYMPVPQAGTQNGAFYTDPKANAPQSYGADASFFSYTQLENSPSAKVLSTTKPGADFQGHSTTFGYGVNGSTDVKKYTVATAWVNGATDHSISLSGSHPAGQLLKTSVTDEDGRVTTEFTNGRGQTVLARKAVSSSQDSDTYYIYNRYGQLAYVIPPLAMNEPLSQATLDNLCYQYRYDSKGRQVEKKLPGKGWEYMVYDPLGRLLMSQDANMGASKQWLFSKYDKYGRTVYTGIYTSSQNYGSAGRAAEQVQAQANAAVQNESRNTGGFEASGVTAYYTNTAYPTAFTKILSISYYDTYPAGSPARPAQVLGKNTIGDAMSQPVNTKNLPTASYVKNIEDDSWTKSFIWYDEKSRAVGTYSVNHLGGYTRTETLPDFAGVPQQTKVYHRRLAGDAEKVITQTFEYDQHNRLKKQWHQVNGSPQELLSENTYNELSQLSNKKTGNNLQNIDYTYNMRGALVKVNDPASQGTKLFAYELKYYSPAGTEPGKRTSNIAEVLWRTAGDNVLRKYAYRYDALNRMTAGIYSEPDASVPQNNFYNETVVYDLGGNITTLQRTGNMFTSTAGLIDNLSYNYTGNRLNAVTDSSGNYSGYPDVSGNTIGYDDNGNMKDHIDKGILQIDYNILDLPDYVKFDKTYIPRYDFGGTDFNVTTRYLYRADGTKLRKLYTYGSGKANMETTKLTDYLDGFQYEAINEGSKYIFLLKFVPTAEGYYDFEKNRYIYSYTDHLGNIRLSYFKNTSGSAEVLEKNDYYPFGLSHSANMLTLADASYQYQYSGKELQKETGWSDFGARMYMADIGRWGVIDPLAETTTRVNPYNYALDNPVMYVDPDGRKAQYLGSEYELFGVENSGIIERFMRQANGFGNFSSFLGDSYFYKGAGSSGGGGGSSTTIGDIMKGFGVELGNLDSFMQMSAVLNLRQQLINAGWDNPESTSAKFNDWWKLVSSKEIPSLNELYTKTNSGKIKLKFSEDSSIRTPGEADREIIKINMNKNKNLLEYAFTMGHEMTHSFTDLHFQNSFYNIYTDRDGRYMRDQTYTFFKEVIGIGWEINNGSTRYGGLSDVQAVRKYYNHIDVRAMDKIQPYIRLLQSEWQKVYNSK